jgi:hypothetical protein
VRSGDRAQPVRNSVCRKLTWCLVLPEQFITENTLHLHCKPEPLNAAYGSNRYINTLCAQNAQFAHIKADGSGRAAATVLSSVRLSGNSWRFTPQLFDNICRFRAANVVVLNTAVFLDVGFQHDL